MAQVVEMISCRNRKNVYPRLSLAFVRGFHRWPVNSPHKGPVTRKMFPFDDVIMMAAILFRPLCLDYNVQYKVYKESNKNNLNSILSFIPFDKAKCLFVEHFKQILTCLLFGVSQLLHNIGCDYSERLYYSKCWSKDCHIMYKNSRAVSAFIGHITSPDMHLKHALECVWPGIRTFCGADILYIYSVER